jgi:hypothetical protein
MRTSGAMIFEWQVRRGGAAHSLLTRCYTLIALVRIAASRLLISSAESWGRSSLIIGLLSVPVNRNGD